MRKITVYLLAVFLFLNKSSSAQSNSIIGSINDAIEGQPLSNAAIIILQPRDSTLISYTRSISNGNFKLQNIKPGKYVVLITFPRYADFSDEYEVEQDKDLDIGKISMTLKSTLLEEVVIRSGAAIRIKGDTTEFIADSFKVKEGATVEELLKQLPGLQVNSKGEITAHGRQVDKVLVDGEEFFGDDPTMATQNISAKAVAKVQVYDTKTEQQNLTGITNGNDGKTVNIQLKEDHKKGAFGKAYTNTDFNKYIDAKALYNKFVGKKKFSTYFSKTNINTGSLSWQEREKLGIEDDWEYDEINDYYISFGGGDEFNDYNLRGLPDAYTAGALFINKWNADKNSVNGSYRFNRLGTTNEGSTLVQNILPDFLTYTNTFSNTRALTQQHAANGKYEWKLDSLASLKFIVASNYRTNENIGSTNSEYLDSLKQPINTSSRVNDNQSNRKQLDNQLVYKQMFNKKNRLLMTTLRYGLVNDEGEGLLNTSINYYKDGMVDSIANVDQMKILDGNSETMGSKFTWNEPLSTKWNLILDYGFNRNKSKSERNTFEKDFNDKYEILNKDFSNNFELTATSNSASTIFRYTSTKLKFAIGSGISSVNLKLKDIDSSNNKSYNFLNFTPQAQINYNIKQQTGLRFNYRGSTRQPSINQLQPLRDNNDPLNVFIGNPDLKVGFNHNINAGYNQYKVLSSKYMYINASYNIIQNAITNNSTIDAQGKRVIYPVNVDGNRNWNFYSSWNKGNGQKKPRYGFQVHGNGGRNINFINNEKSINNFNTFNAYLTFGYEFPDKYSINIRPGLGYVASKSSLRPNLDNNYFTYGGSMDGYIMLPGKIELNNNLNFDLRQKIQAFDQNINIIRWNAEIFRKIFKDKSGKIGIIANDILNQNKGFTRSINSNFVTDEQFQRISRYFLVKFEWSFTKMPTGENK